jgi:hypothetical protein
MALSGCGEASDLTSLRRDVSALKGEIRGTQNAISSARADSERLEGELGREAARVSSLLGGQVSGASQVFLSLSSDLVSDVVKGFLNGYGGVKETPGMPAARWELRGVRTRPAQDRLFVTGSYNIRFGTGECDGPMHGYLIYLERNLLKLADMELRCSSGGREVEIDVGADIPPIPVPIEVRTDWPLEAKEGVRLKAKRLKLLIPMQMELGSSKVNTRTRAVQVEAVY